jgi:hypothetical protein
MPQSNHSATIASSLAVVLLFCLHHLVSAQTQER